MIDCKLTMINLKRSHFIALRFKHKFILRALIMLNQRNLIKFQIITTQVLHFNLVPKLQESTYISSISNIYKINGSLPMPYCPQFQKFPVLIGSYQGFGPAKQDAFAKRILSPTIGGNISLPDS